MPAATTFVMNHLLRNTFSIGLISLCGIIVTSCGIAPQPGTTRLAPTPIGLVAGIPLPLDKVKSEELTEQIPVFIVSSRNIEEKKHNVDPFGNKRNRHESPNLAVGYVNIGEGMTSEEIVAETISERRRKKARVELAKVDVHPKFENINLWEMDTTDGERNSHSWTNALRAQLDKSTSRQVVVFVHGYNTHLITNTEQSAEIFHYLGRQGAVINFEWPSQGKLLGYIQDKGNAEQSTRLFRGMLSSLATGVDASSITVIAHSAGNPIVVNALKELRLLENNATREELRAKYRINRVVLAAPDMDVMTFFNAVFDRFHEVAGGVAVYASPNDKALKLSSLLFADDRLGRSIGKLEDWEQKVLSGLDEIEMIDVSRPDGLYGSPFGHEYFYRNPWVSSDIGAFMFGRSPETRGLVRSETDENFWNFPEDYVERQKARAAQLQAAR